MFLHKKTLLIITLFGLMASFAQQKQFKVSGTLISEEDQTPLESATVFLQRVQDSSLVTYTITNKQGKFQLEDKTYDKELNLFISYVGFQTYMKKVLIEDRAAIDLGNITLKLNTNQLDEVVVRAVAPITIKKDTLEFNVKSFKTKKDATVEDLLKELPGVEVSEDGKIKVNGKDVSKILVNGKPFFGDDLTIATRNLTKDIIEKVQIVDAKTESEVFSGEKGDQENKTINLTIKEENNKGTFGRVAAGGGTDERYEFAGILNFFDNDQRISVLAGGNNINSPGFSFGEIYEMSGGGENTHFSNDGAFGIAGKLFGGGQGITRSRNLGVNYVDELSKKISIYSDYFHSGSNSDNKNTTARENILPDSRYFTNSNSKSSSNYDNHTVNMNLDVKLDSTLLVNVGFSFDFSKNDSKYTSNEVSRDENNVITNESIAKSNTITTGKNFGNVLAITKRFGDRGAFLKWNLTNKFNTAETDDSQQSETNIFGLTPQNIVRNQIGDGERKLSSLETLLMYRLPLIAEELFLDFSYSLRDDRRDSRKSTFDFDTGTQQYDSFNTNLSTDFIYKNRINKPGLSLSYEGEEWEFSVNGGYVFRTLKNEDKLRPQFNLERDFEALEFGASFDIEFSPKASMYLDYSVNNMPPDISQLQAFQDVSNPLNIITGNPSLKPTNNHNFYMGFNNYNFQKGTGFDVYAGGDITNNKVVAKTTIDADFVRNTTYTNVNGDYRLDANMSYSKSVKLDSLHTMKFRLSTYGNFNKSINFNNDVQYGSKNTSVTPNASITFNWKGLLKIEPKYSMTISKTKFDVSDFEDQEFLSHSVGLNTSTFVPKNLEWRNDINYNYNPNVADGFQKSSWFWNTTLAYSILKEKGIVSVKVYDLLNQKTNARRTATANYIQDSQSTVLQRYVMFGFSWKFNSLGKGGEIQDDFYMD